MEYHIIITAFLSAFILFCAFLALVAFVLKYAEQDNSLQEMEWKHDNSIE